MRRQEFIRRAVQQVNALHEVPEAERSNVTVLQPQEQWEIQLYGQWHPFWVMQESDGTRRSTTIVNILVTESGKLPKLVWYRGPNGEHGQVRFDWTHPIAMIGDSLMIDTGEIKIRMMRGTYSS